MTRILLLALLLTSGLSIEVQVAGVGNFFDSVKSLVQDVSKSNLVPDAAQLVDDAEHILTSPKFEAMSNNTLALLSLLASPPWQSGVKDDVRSFVLLAKNLDSILADNSHLARHIVRTSSEILDSLNRSTSLPRVVESAANLLEDLTSDRNRKLASEALNYIVEMEEILFNSPLLPKIIETTAKLLEDIEHAFSQEDTANITQWLIPVLRNTANITEGLASKRTHDFLVRSADRLEQLLLVLVIFFSFLLVCIFLFAIICVLLVTKYLPPNTVQKEGYVAVA